MEDENKRLKMAIIAGASHAIKFKEMNPRSSEADVIKKVTNDIDKILEKIDEEI